MIQHDYPVRGKAKPIKLRVVTWPSPCKDADETIRLYGAEGVQKAIDEAKPAVVWAIDTVDTVGGCDIETYEGKQDAVEDLVELMANLPPFERAARVRQLSDKLNVSEIELRQALNEAYLARHGRPMVKREGPGVDIPRIDA